MLVGPFIASIVRPLVCAGQLFVRRPTPMRPSAMPYVGLGLVMTISVGFWTAVAAWITGTLGSPLSVEVMLLLAATASSFLLLVLGPVMLDGGRCGAVG